jgi:hypothetical protein
LVTYQIALQQVAKGFTKTYIVIDGVDECPNPEDAGVNRSKEIFRQGSFRPRQELLNFIVEIRKWALPELKLLLVSRPNRDIEIAMKQNILEHPGSESSGTIDLQDPSRQNIDGKGQINDLASYIDEKFEEDYFKNVQAEKSDIKSTLIKRSEGV